MQRKLRITKHFSMLYPIHGTRWAVIVYVYRGTAIAVSAVSALVSRYSGLYTAVPRYAVDYYTPDACFSCLITSSALYLI